MWTGRWTSTLRESAEVIVPSDEARLLGSNSVLANNDWRTIF